MEEECLRHIDTQHVTNKNSSFADYIPCITYLEMYDFFLRRCLQRTYVFWMIRKHTEVNDVIRNIVLALNQVNMKVFVLFHVLCLFLMYLTRMVRYNGCVGYAVGITLLTTVMQGVSELMALAVVW